MGIVGASLRVAQLTVGCALLGSEAAAGAGRAVVGAAADAVSGAAGRAQSVVRTATDVVVEAVGGPPARRVSTQGNRHWVEVRGLSGPHAHAIAAEVLRSLRAVPDVTHVSLNRPCARVVVTTAEGTSRDVASVVDDAERRALSGSIPPRQRPHTLPADDAVLVARSISAAAATVGLGLSITGNVMRLPGVPDVLSVIPTVTDHVPAIRRQVERRIGREGADLLLSLLTAASAALTLSPTTAAAETAARAMLVVEAWDARQAWRRHESELSVEDTEDIPPNPGVREFNFGPVERYANRIGWIGIVAATLIGAVSRNPAVAGSAALVTAPKPSRAGREGFSVAMTHGLTHRHDALVVRPRALRVLDRVDAVVIDPRVLYTDELTVTRILGVADAQRGAAWEAVRAALRNGRLEPGWHRLAGIRGAGRSGKALISSVRDPMAAAVVAEARRARPRVVSVDDDGLRSLAQGFDRLQPVDGSLDEALAEAVADLKSDGATVLLLTTSALAVAHTADVTVGLSRDGDRSPWSADVFVRDLESVWRIVHALPAARSVAARGVRLSVSTSTIGALMLLPGVAGRGPEPINVGVLYALWAGFRSGTGIFTDLMPEPETTHDWHALPVDEVRLLLPRPPQEDLTQDERSVTDLAPVRAIRRGAVWSAGLARDFVSEMRENLADPITPLLVTGAAASALLGSPLDAALVGGVLLANAALSAEQQLHAERILRRLIAVQDPLARRRIGPLDQGHKQKVPANRLRVGDIIEVHPDEVVPADARLISATNVEVDESTLTGESLPVTKRTEATPGAPLAERTCMLYDGSTLVAGTALAVVTAVGSRTEMRRAMALAPERSREIGLHRQLSRITRRALPFSVSGGALVGLLSAARGTPLREAVGSAVALTVAAVPEGLPLVATLAQLAAARRLTGESVLIRNAHSVEALARLEVVCFDKTGTLSENRLRVQSTRPVHGWTDEQVLDAALSTTFARPGHRAHHATDDAVRRAVHGNDEGAAAPVERDAFLPFQAGRPFAAAVRGTRLMIKGAPEVLGSALTESNGAMSSAMREMASQGLRVLAVAERRLTADEAAAATADTAAFEALCRSQLTPIGLLGLADTPRDKARSVLEQLSVRGIGVRLITGDHPVTAAVVAREVGLEVTHEQVITGSEWERLSAEEREDAVRTRLVFARMSPEHKIDIVQTLERIGVVTAMVGDGANDAAAIRAASVGVGVAAHGSDPARTAADVLLLEGRIEALIDALDEGQQLWRRVHSAVSMLLGGNTGEIAFALITSLLTGRSVLNARQMLLVNMLTDALPAAALAVSPQTSTDAVDRDEAAMWRAIGIRGAATTIGATLAWLMGRATGTRRHASTVALIGLVSTQLAQTLADSHGPLVVLTALGSFAALATLISIPGLSQVFGCTPVGPLGWGQAMVATAVAGVVAAAAPDLLARITDAMRQRLAGLGVDEAEARAQSVVGRDGNVVDHDHTGLDEDRIEGPHRRSEQAHTRGDEGVRAGGTGEVSHDSEVRRGR